MKQLVSMRYMIDPDEGEKINIQECKSFIKDHIKSLLDEKKSKIDIDSFNIFVLNLEKYLDYEMKLSKHLLDAYKIDQIYSNSIDSEHYGNKAELTIVNRLLANTIQELNYVNNSRDKAIIFIAKIVNTGSEEKAIRSISNNKDSIYAKYTYER